MRTLGMLVAILAVLVGCTSPGCPEGYLRQGRRCTPIDGGLDDAGECALEEACDGVDRDCDGVEDTSDPDAHAWCNAPRRALPFAAARCGASGCEVEACESPRLDCTSAPGCETDPASTTDHCGECHRGCAWDCRASDCDDPVEVGSGWQFHCARRTSGKVACWGNNLHGRLGDGTRTHRSAPVEVLGVDEAVEVSVGEHHACARRSDGRVLCWGSNEHRQLGPGTDALYSERAVEVMPAGSGVVQISAGGFHVCARLENGRVLCWGDNDSGQVGDGRFRVDRAEPFDVGFEDAVEIASGSFHVCVRRATAEVVCWGRAEGGQLGDGHLVYARTRPGEPIAELSATAISAGTHHTCAIRTDGRATCWGMGRYGALGTGIVADQWVPMRPVRSLANVAEVAAAGEHTCARVGAEVYCWGSNERGQLGDGTFDFSMEPSERPVLTDAVEISARGHNTCARRASGQVVCWGDNERGQIGDGTVGMPRRAPGAPVRAPR